MPLGLLLAIALVEQRRECLSRLGVPPARLTDDDRHADRPIPDLVAGRALLRATARTAGGPAPQHIIKGDRPVRSQLRPTFRGYGAVVRDHRVAPRGRRRS